MSHTTMTPVDVFIITDEEKVSRGGGKRCQRYVGRRSKA